MSELDDLLSRIDELEGTEDGGDTDTEDHTWHDAAVWTPDLPDGDDHADDDEFHPDVESIGLCEGDPVVLSLTSRDGSVVVSWDMHTDTWDGSPEAIHAVQTAAANAGCDMEPFEKIGHGMMSVCDDLDAAPSIEVYVAVSPRPVPPAELLTAEHPDGRTVQWNHGEWSGDRDLAVDADELRRRHREPDSLAAVAEALIEVCNGGTMNPAVWAAAGVPF